MAPNDTVAPGDSPSLGARIVGRRISRLVLGEGCGASVRRL